MSLISIQHTIDGVLTDATSVVLSDSTGTYGIQRVDTGATVVAAGTAVSHPSTGLYTYDTSLLNPAQRFVAVWQVTDAYGTFYESQTIQSGGTKVQDILMEIGRLIDGVGPAGFVTGTATDGSSGASLEDAVLLKSGIAQDDLYQDCWVWRPTAVNASDVERVVKIYSPSAGTLAPDVSYIASPSAGETYAIFRLLSPGQIMGCLNRALRRMHFEWEVTLTPNASPLVRRYDVTSQYAWLQESWQIRRAGYLTNGMSRDTYDPYDFPIRGHAYRQDNTLYAWLPAGYQNASFYLKTVRPHATLVNGADTTDGVTAPTDTLDVALDWVVAGTMTEVYDLLLKTGDKTAQEQLMPEASRNAGRFTRMGRAHFRMPKDTFTFSELLTGGYGDESGLSARAS